MQFRIRDEILPLAMLAAMFALALWTWPNAPDRLPIHWGPSGEPDGYGSRFEGLLLMPLITLGVYGLFFAIPRIDPRRRHYEQFRGVYRVVRTLIVGFMFLIYLWTHLWFRGHRMDPELVVSALVGALFLGLGNYLPKIKSNWFIGVRTPWTLSSEESWRRTHRLAGWLFVISGVVILAGAVAAPSWAPP